MLIELRTLLFRESAFRLITWFNTLNLQNLKKRLLISSVPIYIPAPSSNASHAVPEVSLGRLFLKSSFNFETRFLSAHFR